MADTGESKAVDAARSKHRKSTCAGCRKRKSKCDGRQPRCTTCVAYKEQCVYDKPPSLAYVRSLEEQIGQLRQQLRDAKIHSTQVNAEESSLDRQSAGPQLADRDTDESSSVVSSRKPSYSWETDISVDAQGSVSFHNSTSAIHEPPTDVQQTVDSMSASIIASPLSPISADGMEHEHIKRSLLLNAATQRQFEAFGIENTAVKANVTNEVARELLNYHWCWIHPMLLMVYRPAFTRGMALFNANSPGAPETPYFSDTLLKVIYGHCARFLAHSVYQRQYQTISTQGPAAYTELSSSQFMAKLNQEARISLGMETLKPSSIPTIQALLQQSAREIPFGSSSQAWLYSGMAFRMAIDIGIHLPSEKLQLYVKSLSPEDIEIRKRLFWSCYTWDKIISIYLGRMPNFTPATHDVPLTFMDDSADTELWTPYYGESAIPPGIPVYQPCPGYVVSCFGQMCKLCIILNDLLFGIYSTPAAEFNYRGFGGQSTTPGEKSEKVFFSISHDLNEWWVSVPSYLRIPPDQLPPASPPAHIVSLNLLYHTALILLHRPYILGARDLTQPSVQKSYSTCISATAAIHDLLILQANTFGLSHVSYLNAYCAYIAATIAVLRFEREHRLTDDTNVSMQKLGLNFLLDVLQKTAVAMPALDRSVAIIRKRMKAVLDRHNKNRLETLFPGSDSSHSQFMMRAQQAFDFARPPSSSNMAQFPFIAEDQSLNHASVQNVPWQNNVMSGIYPESSSSEDILPAFPGQRFSVSSDHSIGSDVDPQVRATLMGFNLDPHPALDHGNSDWSLTDSFVKNEPH